MNREDINAKVRQFNDSLYDIEYTNDLQICDMKDQLDALQASWTTEGGQQVIGELSTVFDDFEEAMTDMANAVSAIKGVQVSADFEEKKTENVTLITPISGRAGGED